MKTQTGRHLDRLTYRNPSAAWSWQETSVVNKIPDQQKRDDFCLLLNSKVDKSAGAGVTIPVRYELKKQDNSSPLALSDAPQMVSYPSI
jgi:hypothetical protein